MATDYIQTMSAVFDDTGKWKETGSELAEIPNVTMKLSILTFNSFKLSLIHTEIKGEQGEGSHAPKIKGLHTLDV